MTEQTKELMTCILKSQLDIANAKYKTIKRNDGYMLSNERTVISAEIEEIERQLEYISLK